MTEIVIIFILVGSVCGASLILIRKIPVLAELPIQENKKQINQEENNKKILGKIPVEIILQKLLSKIRVLILKTENKISHWSHQLRQRSLEKKNFSENYWEKITKKRK